MEDDGMKGSRHVKHNVSLLLKQNQVAVKTDIGSKIINQDVYMLEAKLMENAVLIGVFDGHGEFGHQIAQAAKTSLVEKLKDFSKIMEPEEALKSGFAETQKLLLEHYNEAAQNSGTSATLAWICSDCVYIANVGDSSACIVNVRKEPTTHLANFRQSDNNNTNGYLVSIEHRAELHSECERVERAGGVVKEIRYSKISVPVGERRIYMPNSDFPGGTFTRSLGDLDAHKYCGFISEPDIKVHRWTTEDSLLVLATNGLWEVYDCRTLGHACQELLLKASTPQVIAQELVNGAILAKSGADNATVIVFNLESRNNNSTTCNIV